MKRFVLILILAIVFVMPSLRAEEQPQNQDMEKEKAAITQAVLDYGEGWYTGNVERMQKALHPELIKRTPANFPGGNAMIQNLGFSAMVEFTRKNKGRKLPFSPDKMIIQILDANPETASAKMLTPDFIDYVHLVKFNGEWKIINVLWIPNNTPPPPPPPTKKPEKLE